MVFAQASSTILGSNHPIGLFFPIESRASFVVAAVLSAAARFGLGAAKVLSTERSWFRSGLDMLAVGGLAAGVAYLVGYLLQRLGR